MDTRADAADGQYEHATTRADADTISDCDTDPDANDPAERDAPANKCGPLVDADGNTGQAKREGLDAGISLA